MISIYQLNGISEPSTAVDSKTLPFTGRFMSTTCAAWDHASDGRRWFWVAGWVFHGVLWLGSSSNFDRKNGDDSLVSWHSNGKWTHKPLKMYVLLEIVIFHCSVSLPQGHWQIDCFSQHTPNNHAWKEMPFSSKHHFHSPFVKFPGCTQAELKRASIMIGSG